MSQTCQKCGKGWTEQHTCQKDGSFRTTEHLSEIPYDSALVELLKNVSFEGEKRLVIVAYELGRRRGLLSK